MRISDWSSDVFSSDLLDWGLHGERVVGAFAVELADKIIETGLLLQDVGAARAGRLLLQRQVHALVAAVLLRLAWFDAFDLNAEPEPPDRELRQVVEPVGAGEGNAVVRADGVGQAALLEQALKDRNDASPFHALEGFASANEPRGVIGDGQGVKIAALAHLEPASEDNAPQIIGRLASHTGQTSR